MPHSPVDITEFLSLQNALVVDVRSPGEFAQARIPGALSMPLFSDAQRAEIGTLYKQAGKEKAMLHALDYYGPNVKLIVTQLQAELKQRGKTSFDKSDVVVQCWRGGMRSGVVCWMLDLFGYEVRQLQGGYKTFRRWALKQLEKDYNVVVLGGRTGAAKTETLLALAKHNERIVDLEGLAQHKGSAFGGLGFASAPSQEQFENDLAWSLRAHDTGERIWFEDESQRIGLCTVPNKLWSSMRKANVFYLDVPFEVRLEHLARVYGAFPISQLIDATVRIRKKLGGQQMQQAIDLLDKKQLKDAFAILLRYYDKAYDEATSKRKPDSIIRITTDTVDPETNAQLLLNAIT
ncbi:MAG TPA: tRNA 2-selenouridine(34) synthase MnmH [Chitinophagales bacterium]|nr:tRNA 2-selenouridine(34) synthase MnmH [Chitinophagales bacterium]